MKGWDNTINYTNIDRLEEKDCLPIVHMMICFIPLCIMEMQLWLLLTFSHDSRTGTHSDFWVHQISPTWCVQYTIHKKIIYSTGKSCLPCSWHIVLLWCMHLWSFMNIFHKVWELWPGHKSGTDGRTDGCTGQTGVTLNALPLFFE